MKLASAAPVTPILGRETKVATILRITSNAGHVCPVPKMRNGASTMLSAILSTCKMTVGWTIPVARRADPSATNGNCSSSAGRNQSMYDFASRAVSASALSELQYQFMSTKPQRPSAIATKIDMMKD